MQTIITCYQPFPCIAWWVKIAQTEIVIFDKAEYFRKMTFRNKYCISGANNVNKLSVPIQKGRNQKSAMCDIYIFNEENWQLQHWKTIQSTYRKSPYFEYYEADLYLLFKASFENLIDFNLESIHWVKKQLKYTFCEQIATNYIRKYPIEILDLRDDHFDNLIGLPKYYQLFEDRIGFHPNLSILDLLFSLGPDTQKWLLKCKNKQLIN